MLVGGVAAHDVWKKARCKKAMKKSSMACLPHALSIMIDHDVKCLLFPFFRSPFFFHKRNSAQRDKEPFSFSFSKFSTCIWTLDLLLTELLKKKYEADALIKLMHMRVIIIDPRTFFLGWFAQNLDFRIGPLCTTQNSLFLNKTLS